MSDPLYELLVPYLPPSRSNRPPSHPSNTATSKYLSRLTTLSLNAVTSDEPTTLSQSTHSNILALQSLSARSTTALVASSTHLASLRSTLPLLASSASSLRNEIPSLDTRAVSFSDRYSRSREENEVLDRRKRALLLARNIDRLSDILDLPTLLESAIGSSSAASTPASASSVTSRSTGAASTPTTSAGTPSTTIPTATSSTSSSYASALDLHSHIKRLHLLYPDSPLVSSIAAQTESAMREMTAQLIQSLRAQNIKLAAGMRTIGWLRRVAPELDGSSSSSSMHSAPGGEGGGSSRYASRTNTISEGSLGALFLVCRLSTLMTMISALAPLQDLADQETELRHQRRQRQRNAADLGRDEKGSKRGGGGGGGGGGGAAKDANATLWASGQQTERYLKRFIEIFREQSFAIVSMYRSIFPNGAAEVTAASSSSARLIDPRSKSKTKTVTASKTKPSPTTGREVEEQDEQKEEKEGEDPLLPTPAALATFPIHLTTNLLMTTLRTYLPNVQDKSSRESLLTQVLYCAGSLGRLGGDFSLMLAGLEEEGEVGSEGGRDGDVQEEEEEEEEDDDDSEWVSVMKKHRFLAGKLEKMAGGGGVPAAGAGEN